MLSLFGFCCRVGCLLVAGWAKELFAACGLEVDGWDSMLYDGRCQWFDGDSFIGYDRGYEKLGCLRLRCRGFSVGEEVHDCVLDNGVR